MRKLIRYGKQDALFCPPSLRARFVDMSVPPEQLPQAMLRWQVPVDSKHVKFKLDYLEK